jgi:hypothetical protein
MNDERLGQEISDFYRETDVMPPDSKGSAREVAARLSQVEQAKRRRWRPTWLTRATHQPRPIPATNGHTPTVIGRTTSMLSPAKAITAGAIVFAIGGVMLIAQPFGQQSGTPGAEAEAEPAAPVEVSGQWQGFDPNLDHDYAIQHWSMSDPRLEGTFKWFWTEWKDPDSNPVTFAYSAYVIENDGGTWRGLPDAWVSLPGGESESQDVVMEGEGGYEGLTFIARFEGVPPGIDMRGYIIDDAFPLPPDFTATE